MLASQGSPPVRKDELAEIDEMLHASLKSRDAEGTRCPHCHGYASVDGDGDLICLNCGRPAIPPKKLTEVIDEITVNLLRYRKQHENGS